MEIELVQETKKMCEDIFKSLKAKHAELKEGGANVTILNEVVSDMNKVIEIYKEVNEENVLEKNIEVINLKDTLDEKYFVKEEEVPELEEPVEETEEEKSEETEDEEDEEKKSNKTAVALGAAGVVLLGGIAVHTGLEARRSRAEKASTEVVEETSRSIEVVNPTEAPVETPAPTEAPKEETESNELKLVLGEYGTFFDVNDEEQLNARAKYIFDNYFANNETLTEQQKQLITVENIANTIRIMNGVLPINEEGYEFFDGMTLNDYTNVLVEAVINVPSNVNDHYTYFPAYLLTVDGSEESDFIKSYSEIYDKLIYSLNEHDDEQVQDAIACLGFKFYNEWYLQGMYEGDVNPHLFNTELKYLTFISTIEPYNTTAREWHLSEKKPVCIYACKDYETGEKALVSVNDIVVALETGAWNNVGAKLGDMKVEPVQWLAEYYEALNDSLSWKYDHREVKTLK